jgi:hypothetical protein
MKAITHFIKARMKWVITIGQNSMLIQEMAIVRAIWVDANKGEAVP